MVSNLEYMQAINYDTYGQFIKKIIISECIRDIIFEKRKKLKKINIIDLGCGQGTLLLNLFAQNLITSKDKIIGIDYFESLTKNINKLNKNIQTINTDVANLSIIQDNSVDIILSTQVIEHIDNEEKFIAEIYRVLKPSGVAYISTVLKKPYSFWFYKNKEGARVLDPTHVREYKTVAQLVEKFKKYQFDITKTKTSQIYFPINELLIRFIAKWKKTNPEYIFNSNKFLNKFSFIVIPIIGYENLELVVEK